MHNDAYLPASPTGLQIEVHHYFNNHHDTREVDVGQLLQRRVRVKTAHGELPALAPEDDAVYLALHATTHALVRLAWLYDLSVLNPDWLEAARRARAWKIDLAVAPAWERARDLLAVPIPEEALQLVRPSPLHHAGAQALLKLADSSQGELHRFAERSFRMSVVPVMSIPRVLLQKLRGRREEAAGYASLKASEPH
jgi:hypothetical protein